MIDKIKLAVNTSIYDGYDIDIALSSIKKCGFNFFELAYNQGYVSDLRDNLFNEKNANYINSLKTKYGLQTLALGCTMDLAVDNLFSIFLPRLRFANLIGVKHINVCTTQLANKKKLVKNLISLKPLLEEFNCILCLENAGDYHFNAFTTLNDGIKLLTELDSESYALNFDPGNMVTYQPNLDVVSQAIQSIEYCRYFHIKDVITEDNKFKFTSIGEGNINYLPIIPLLMKKEIPCSLEIPLRIYRDLDSTPRKKTETTPLDTIEKTIIKSRYYIENINKGLDFNE